MRFYPDEELKAPVKAFRDTFSAEQIVLDMMRAPGERVYSINDNPNSLRRLSGYVAYGILATLAMSVVVALISTGGH